MSDRNKPSVWTGKTVEKLFGKQELAKSPPIKIPSSGGLSPMNQPISKSVQKSKAPILKPVTVKPKKSPVLGFSSQKEFRDLTRPLAQKHRGSKIIVTGSSVTGYSHKKQVPFGSHSDIDLGLVNPKLRKSSQVDYRGFPVWSSKLGVEERRLQKSFRETKGRKTGIKVFSDTPERAHYVRPHTPPPQRKKYL